MEVFRASRLALVIAAFLAFASFACFAYPLYVIRPFRSQGAAELHAALFVLRVGPWFSIACAAACVAVVAFAWPRGWFRRTAAVVCVLVAAAGAMLARFNLYEQLMFHPIRGPQFEAAARAKIDADDKVLAIRVNGVSRAYPIREIAYHHVVNDAVGGEPVVATY